MTPSDAGAKAAAKADAEARAMQRAAFARMTPNERAARAMAMADEVKQLTLDGIRMRHPDYDDDAVHREWFLILHGPELTNEILGFPNQRP